MRFRNSSLHIDSSVQRTNALYEHASDLDDSIGRFFPFSFFFFLWAEGNDLLFFFFFFFACDMSALDDV